MKQDYRCNECHERLTAAEARVYIMHFGRCDKCWRAMNARAYGGPK